MANISVLILTLNEEDNLANCLESCRWCDDVVVFDSFSTDRTVQIARQYGARVEQREFDNYAAQRMAALNEIEYRHDWVLMLDADECVAADLAAEMQHAVLQATADTTMLRMRRKDFFFGRWLRRSSGYPTWFGRLVRPKNIRIERAINEEYLTEGRIEALQCHLEHHPFNKGIDWWYERHNRYSSLEAQATLYERTEPLKLVNAVSSDPVVRRRALKRLVYRLPLRPMIIFIYLYIVRLGLFDGRPGLYFCAMRASYELMIDLKLAELRRLRQQRSLPA